MATKITHYIILVVACLLFQTGCKDADNDISTRNFMPINVTCQCDGVNSVTITWEAVNKAVSYTVLLFSDVDKTNLVNQQIVTSNTCTITDLESNRTYYYQICANNSDANLNSKWQEGFFVFKRDNLFDTPTINSDSVMLSWNKQITTLTHICLTTDSSTINIQLTELNKTNKCISVHGLTPNTLYQARIYIGTTVIDETSFTTKDNIESSGDIYISPTDDLISIINNCNSGSTIHLSAGIYAYGDKEIVINNKSLTIESTGNDEDSYPELHIKRISLKGNVGTVSIRNLALSGFALGGKSPTEKNDYFIDLNSDFISADSIIVEGCTIHYLENCAIRGSRGLGTQKVQYIGLKNCILTDINSEGENQYELFKLDSLQLGEFRLEECTIYNTAHGIINNRNNHNTALLVIIKNCTINDFGSTSSNPRKYLLEFSNSAGIIDFENNILSNLKGFSTSESYMSKGFSFGQCSPTSINNLFYNMPFTVQEAGEWSNSTDNIDDIDPQYADTGIGDFTIGNSIIKGKNIGASTWLK